MDVIDWKEHIRLRDNVELLKLYEVVYSLIANLQVVTIPFNFMKDLFTYNNMLYSTFTMTVFSLVLLNFELMIPCLLFLCAMRVVHISYSHERFKQLKPDVEANI